MAGGRVRMPVDGLLLLDKPLGWSSNQALKKAQHLLNAAKAGHCGTLDPLASGLLPVVLGEATKFANDILDADKTYLADVRLGTTTETGDTEGKIIDTGPAEVSRPQWDQALQLFRGEIEQTPPMYSALKHEGKPLYRYAREGIEIERTSRRIQIHEIETLAFEPPDARIRVRCSKGTYIRTLAVDIGAELRCGAHLSGLRRVRIAELDVNDAISIDAFGALEPEQRLARVLPLDYLLRGMSALLLQPEHSRRFRLGQRIRLSEPGTGAQVRQIRVYNQFESSAHLLGLARLDDGLLSPVRVMNPSNKDSETV